MNIMGLKGDRKFKLEGTVQYMWTILSFVGRKNKRNVYFCRCECGTEKEANSNGSKMMSKCCGCKRVPNWKKGRKSPASEINIYSGIVYRYKTDAADRGLAFDLSDEQTIDLLTKPCFYCDKDKTGKHKYGNWGIVEYTGIDRVNNLIGYNLENCVSCCKTCNILKKSITPEIIKKAYEFLFGEK